MDTCWITQNSIGGKSTMVEIRVWCGQTTSRYLHQCCIRIISPYGVTGPQWVNISEMIFDAELRIIGSIKGNPAPHRTDGMDSFHKMPKAKIMTTTLTISVRAACVYFFRLYAMDYPFLICKFVILQWRHNGRDGVSTHQPDDCLLNRLFRRRSKKTSKLRVTGLYAGNSPGTGAFPAQMASNAENVSICWDHHACDKSSTPYHEHE